MANLKIFVSSTCYDLNIVRGQLRTFISELGYEPVMSDYNDVLYDPRDHTHESCIKEIQSADMVVLIVGSRFGGKAVPKAVESIDIDSLKNLSKSPKFLDDSNISITQLEVLKAIELEIPIFTFIDSKVSHDHLFYEKNKGKRGFLKGVDFPSIDKTETAVFIFEFINFIRHRTKNNSIVDFTKYDDIKDFLTKQWSALFQRLLYEQKTKKAEVRRFDFLTSQLTDIKTTLLTSITNSDLKDTARGAIKFRRLIDFLSGISGEKQNEILLSDKSFDDVIKACDIVESRRSEGTGFSSRNQFLIKKDGTFFQLRFPIEMERMSPHWADFKELSEESKKAIINAVLDNEDHRMRNLRYVNEDFEEYISNKMSDSENEEDA
ncbi:MAG: DUF4062 domain-containing protein [Cytophagales bacterium]|nr:DUF4062 domain-containing protein [Cytophagales bacterium]